MQSMSFRRRSGARVASLGVAVLLGACGGADGLGPAGTRSSSVTQQPTDTGPRTSAGGTGAPTTASPAADPTTSLPSGKALVSVETEVPRGVGDQTQVRVRLDVASMERIPGELVEVRFQIRNLDDARYVAPFETLGQGARYDLRGAAILDLVGGRRYGVVLDTGGTCLCTSIPIGSRVAARGSASYYARFGAPPPATKVVDLELPGFLPVRAIPLS